MSTYIVTDNLQVPATVGTLFVTDNSLECYISEFVGTFFLVLTIGFNVLQATALAPISIGAMLMAMIFATGSISGAHFNPAVTLGVYWRGKIDGEKACYYAFSQLMGGVVAGCAYLVVLGATFNIGPGAGYGLGSVLMAEVLFTAALVFVVLSVATTRQDEGNWYYGLAIGFTVMAAAFAIGPISGCSLNPAVTFGILFSSWIHTGSMKVGILILYTLAAIFGAALAVGLFGIVREQEYKVKEVEQETQQVIYDDPYRKYGQTDYYTGEAPRTLPPAPMIGSTSFAGSSRGSTPVLGTRIPSTAPMYGSVGSSPQTVTRMPGSGPVYGSTPMDRSGYGSSPMPGSTSMYSSGPMLSSGAVIGNQSAGMGTPQPSTGSLRGPATVDLRQTRGSSPVQHFTLPSNNA